MTTPPKPILIGSHVSPLGTVSATNPNGGIRTIRSGERFEVISLDDHFVTLAPAGDPEGAQLTCQRVEVELW